VDYFDYSQELTEDLDIESFLEESQEQQKQRLNQELERISEQLEKRESIHQETLNELESKLDWYIERFETLRKRSFGNEEEKQRLKQQIKEFYREIRQEKQQRWRDRQELEKERRQLLRDLEEINEFDEDSSWLDLL